MMCTICSSREHRASSCAKRDRGEPVTINGARRRAIECLFGDTAFDRLQQVQKDMDAWPNKKKRKGQDNEQRNTAAPV